MVMATQAEITPETDTRTQKKLRATKKACLTRIGNELKAHMRDNPELEDINNVNDKFENYRRVFAELMAIHKEYTKLLGEDDDHDEAESYMFAVQHVTTELQTRVEEWLNFHHPKSVVNPADSVSQVNSSATTTSSRAKSAAKRASLHAKATMLKERQLLEMAEFQLRQQKEELYMRTELAMAEAEEKAYITTEQETIRDTPISATSNDDNHGISTPSPGVTLPTTEVTEIKPQAPTDQPMSVWQSPRCTSTLSPSAPVWQPSGDATVRDSKTPTSNRTEQQQLLEALHLPRAELMSFDGDPLHYWIFTRAFQNSVDNTSLGDAAKLTRLLQYCTGKAQKVIQCCAVMDPNIGYSRALNLLKGRFGNDYVVAEAWLDKITNGGIISANDKQSLRDYADDLNSCIETLNSMGYIAEMNNQKVLVCIAGKLPMYLRTRWVRESRRIRKRWGRTPAIADLAEFIEDAAEEANDPVYAQLNTKNKESGGFGTSKWENSNTKPKFRSRGSAFNVSNETTPVKCLKCSKAHTLFGCDEFKGLKPDERLSFARDKRLCFNCLKVGHMVGNCRLNRTCTVVGCGKKHTKFLHQPSAATVNPTGDNTALKGPSVHSGFTTGKLEPSSCAVSGAGGTQIALPVVAVNVRASSNGRCVPTYALLDTGSTSSFCSEELVRQMGIMGKEQTLSLTTLNNKSKVTNTTVVSLEVVSIDDTYSVKIPVVYSRVDIPIRSENIAREEDLREYSHLSDLRVPHVQANKVGLLLGQDVPQALMPLDVRVGEKGEPYATLTNLGWVVSGPIGQNKGNTATSHFCNTSSGSLELQLSKFWKIESSETLAQETKELSVDDRKVVSLWEDTVRLKDGHYELGIPFKEQPLDLPDNREVAENRLQSLAKRLKRDPELCVKYCSGMEEVISKGYAHLVPKEELEGPKGAVWYLPHHPVINPRKPEKVRIVYDCAAKHLGTSLNDNVLQGPDLANKLFSVLLRFRVGRIALMADIEAMFYQVRVTPGNQDVLRFLWWPEGNMDVEPLVYRMGVHLFGGTWSPSCCNFVLNKTAEDNQQHFHRSTIETVQKNFYVDDCLKSTDTEDKAIELYSELSDLLSRGGFKLTKWVTNNKYVLNCIADEHRAKTVKGLDLNYEALPAERALGVYWDVHEDCFGYKFNLCHKPLTRRGLLSTVSSIYDPLGFSCPFTIKAKAIIQDLCRKGLGWDEGLPKEQLDMWLCWKGDLPRLDNFVVPRCLSPYGKENVSHYELHHFSDASETAYGSVSYLRVVHLDGNIYCSIVMAKAHLAPLKQLTIPRLELTAATLSVKLDTMIRRELDIPIRESIFWTDSTIVLQYINNRERRFQTFVANRIAMIHSGSAAKQWRHVPTSLNPADDVSRGLTSGELIGKKSWIQGPEYLWGEADKWPQGPVLPVLGQDPEVKVVKVKVDSYQTNQLGSTDVLQTLFERRSSWYKLKRDVGWILRFKCYLRCKVSKEKDSNIEKVLTVEDLRLAEEAIVRYVQKQSYGDTIKNKSVPNFKKSNPLRKLNPQLTKSGLMCVGGRLCNAPIDDRIKHPVILPKDSQVTRLVIQSIHEENGHVGSEQVLAVLRERFWVVGARSVVRKVLRQCVSCRRLSAPRLKQKMADLPTDRLSPDLPPFSHVGMDFFGPFMVKRGRCQVKRYGCIFTCLVIRAIHIEVAHTLDTDSVIYALQRFMARRGQPVEIRSDNGSNFVGAERELRETIRAWNQQKIDNLLKQKMITWRFNTPLASHMGGVWERLIRTTRKVLYSLTREQVLDDEKLPTLMCLVESIVNSRPLTYVSDDVRDLEPLTPNHLLLLRPGSTFPADTFDKKDMYCKRRWRQVQYMAGVFWRRWLREYIVVLQQRQKWIRPERNLDSGDIVLIVDEDLPRNRWILGKVIETYPGRDNLVRSVKIKTQTGSLTRPVTKLCLLEAVERVEQQTSKGIVVVERIEI